MKSIPKKYKNILYLFIFIALVRIFCISLAEKVDKENYTSRIINIENAIEIPCTNLSQDFISPEGRLNKIHLIFTGIAEDKTGHIVLKIMSEDDLIYQTQVSLVYLNNWEWKDIFVNAEIKQDKEYKISLTASDDCIQIPNVLVVTKENASPESVSSYESNEKMEGEIAIMFGYLQAPDAFERIVISSLWVLFLIIVYFSILNHKFISRVFCHIYEYFNRLVNLQVLISITETIACFIILNCSGIDFQETTKILLISISLLVSLNMKEKQLFISNFADSAIKKYFLFFLYIYGGFALTGQRILIYPLNGKITLAGLFVFGIAVLWFIPVTWTILSLLSWMCDSIFETEKNTFKTYNFICFCALLLLLPAVYNLYANNPGITTGDTLESMITSAHHLHGTTDWHPAFYCMVLRVILTVWDSTYMVIFVQYFFWVYVFIELFLYLRKKGITDTVLLFTAFLLGINAGNFLHLNTIWKDIPYVLSMLWSLIILAKLAFDYEEYKAKWYIYFELIISLVGIFFYRKNGIVSFAIISVMLCIFLCHNKKIWYTLAITAAIIFTIKGPVYSYFEVQDTGKGGMYIGLSQDILGVYYAGGDVSEDTLKMINVMTNYKNSEYEYTPTWSHSSYSLDVKPTKFIYNYLDTFINNPILMIKAVIAREDALWDIYMGQDSVLGCVNFYGTIDGNTSWNDYYPARNYNSLFPLMAAFTDYTANTQWIAAIEWRTGLYMLLGMIAFVFAYIICGFKRYLLISAPIIGQILSLLLTTGWSDFRYFWPLNLMNIASIFLLLVICRNQKESEKNT